MIRECLAIIPARGGSKGIPKKNLRELCGKPLIQFTFDAAKKSRLLTRILLSTDSEEIAGFGRSEGIDVPFLRPAELARDETPTLPVIQHALSYLKDSEDYSPQIVVMLQPTAPLRSSQNIDEAVELLISSQADSVVSVCEVPGHYNPHWQFVIEDNKLKIFTGESFPELISRRQILPKTFTRNGAIYAYHADNLNKYASIYGWHCVPYIMSGEQSVNIDSWEDWLLAELRLKESDG